ncbi:hypothetical protein [Nocardia alni]|uniref:hypothetical protein n=1 Tax=Nocardia alni TaxID=2815723 RepID=UPI001C21461E|nr:hypothetical protein [Nocardia alni]
MTASKVLRPLAAKAIAELSEEIRSLREAVRAAAGPMSGSFPADPEDLPVEERVQEDPSEAAVHLDDLTPSGRRVKPIESADPIQQQVVPHLAKPPAAHLAPENDAHTEQVMPGAFPVDPPENAPRNTTAEPELTVDWAAVGKALLKPALYIVDRATGLGRWISWTALGEPDKNKESMTAEIFDTELSPGSLAAPDVFSNYHPIDASTDDGAVSGIDFTGTVAGAISNIRVVERKPTKMDSENWRQVTDRSGQGGVHFKGHRGGPTVSLFSRTSAEDAEEETYFGLGLGGQGTMSDQDHVAAEANSSTNYSYTYGAEPMYEFTADAEYILSVTAATRNLLRNPFPGGSRTKAYSVKIPDAVMFYLTRSDLDSNPELAELVREKLEPDLKTGSKSEDPLPSGYRNTGQLGSGIITKVDVSGKRNAFEDLVVGHVHAKAGHVTDPESFTYIPGVRTRINKATSDLGVLRLLNGGPNAREIIRFIDARLIVPRLVTIKLTARIDPNADLDDLVKLNPRLLEDSAMLDFWRSFSGADGNALSVPEHIRVSLPGATSVGKRTSRGLQGIFSPGGKTQSGWQPAATFSAGERSNVDGTHLAIRGSGAWTRAATTTTYSVPYELTVTVTSRLLTEALLADLVSKGLTGLTFMGRSLIYYGQHLAAMVLPPQDDALVEPETEPEAKDDSKAILADALVRFHTSEARAGAFRRSTTPGIYESDPTAARQPAPEGSHAIEMNPPADLKSLLVQKPWKPAKPFVLRRFAGETELIQALRAVDPTLDLGRQSHAVRSLLTYLQSSLPKALQFLTPDSDLLEQPNFTNPVLNMLQSLATSGQSVRFGSQAVAPFLDSDVPSGTVPTPAKNSVDDEGIYIRVSIHAPVVIQPSERISMEETANSENGYQSLTGKVYTFNSSGGFGSPATNSDNRNTPTNIPLAGRTVSHDQPRGTTQQTVDYMRRGSQSKGSDGYYVQAVLVIEVQGRNGTLWVSGDGELETFDKPPGHTDVEKDTGKTDIANDAGHTDISKQPMSKTPLATIPEEPQDDAPKDTDDPSGSDPQKPETEKPTPDTSAIETDKPVGEKPAAHQLVFDALSKDDQGKPLTFATNAIRGQRDRSPVVGGIPAPAGYVWESMRGNGDCFFYAMERVAYRTAPSSDEELAERIAKLRWAVTVKIAEHAYEPNGYFHQFNTLIDAARIAPDAGYVSPEELQVLLAARKNGTLREDFATQVQNLANQGIWSTAASHLVPSAASAVLRDGNILLGLRSEAYPTSTVILGEETDAPPHATVLIHQGHYHLAIPTGAPIPHTPAPAKQPSASGQSIKHPPAKTWNDFADLLGTKFTESTTTSFGKSAAGLATVALLGDESGARYMWLPATGELHALTGSAPVTASLQQLLDSPEITLIRTPGNDEHDTTPTDNSTDPILDNSHSSSSHAETTSALSAETPPDFFLSLGGKIQPAPTVSIEKPPAAHSSELSKPTAGTTEQNVPHSTAPAVYGVIPGTPETPQIDISIDKNTESAPDFFIGLSKSPGSTEPATSEASMTAAEVEHSLSGGSSHPSTAPTTRAHIDGVSPPEGVWESQQRDGNCLFHAVARILGMSDDAAHEDLRAHTVEAVYRSAPGVLGESMPRDPPRHFMPTASETARRETYERIRRATFEHQLETLLLNGEYNDPAAEFLLPTAAREFELNLDIVHPDGVTQSLHHGRPDTPVHTLFREDTGGGHYHVAVHDNGIPVTHPQNAGAPTVSTSHYRLSAGAPAEHQQTLPVTTAPTDDSAPPRPGTYDFADFVSRVRSGLHDTRYRDGTKLYLQTQNGDVGVTFDDGRAAVVYTTTDEPAATRSRTDDGAAHTDSPITDGTHTAASFWEQLTDLTPGDIQLVTVIRPPKTEFIPEDDDTYFGDLFDFEYPAAVATVNPARGIPFHDIGIEPPAALPMLSLEERQALPKVAVPVEIPAETLDDGSDAVTFVGKTGHVSRLPLSGEMDTRKVTSGGSVYYEATYSDGTRGYVPVDLTEDFTFEPDHPGGIRGTLSWELPRGQTRFVGQDETNRTKAIFTVSGDTVMARTGDGTSQWITRVGDEQWFRVTAPHDSLPMPELSERHDDPLFFQDPESEDRSGPRSQDAFQGGGQNCKLIAPLKHLAVHNPHAITNMLYDHGDGTVSVRFKVGGAFVWDRHEKSVYVIPGTTQAISAGHHPGKPLWAAMIEKAYAHRFGDMEGFAGIPQGTPAAIAEVLGLGFYQAPGSSLRQPVRAIDDGKFLNPLWWDYETLHALFPGAPAHPTDNEFFRAVADSFDHWREEAENLRTTAIADIRAAHPVDIAAQNAAWLAFLARRDLLGRRGFRRYLDSRFPNRWKTEKNTLTNYVHRMSSGLAQDRVIPDRYRIAAQTVGYRIGYVLERGTTVMLGTHMFGSVSENTTAVPGLVGNHAYAVLRLERDENGTPIRVLLENPWNHNELYPTPVAGIEYRLDPHHAPDSGAYIEDEDAEEDGALIRVAEDGTIYRISADGIRHERQTRDGTVFTVTQDGTRSVEYLGGSKNVVLSDGTRMWIAFDGTQTLTLPNHTKWMRESEDHDWSPDPDRIDPPDDTIPDRGGLVAVDLAHLPKFSTASMHGAGALGLYGAATGAPSAPATQRHHRHPVIPPLGRAANRLDGSVPQSDSALADTQRPPRTVPAANTDGPLDRTTLAPAGREPGRAAASAPLARPDGTVEPSDGSTPHSPLSADEHTSTPHGTTDAAAPEENLTSCGPLSLRALISLGNKVARLPVRLVGVEGMTAEELQDDAGGPLQFFHGHNDIAQHLIDLGHDSTALVVDTYHGPADEHGVGAHAYVLVNDHGTITVHDPSTGVVRPLGRHTPAYIQTTHAILYTPTGHPHTVERTATHPLPSARIGLVDSGEEREQFEFDEFESKFFGADYPPGTQIYFWTASRSIRAIFGAEEVTTSYAPPTETSRRTVDDFWAHLRSEHTEDPIGQVTVVQPALTGSVADRVFDIPGLTNELDDESFTTGTTISFRDTTGTKTAVVRYDGNLEIGNSQSTPGERSRIVTGNQFIDLLVGEYAATSVRVTLPAPKYWHRVRPGADNLFHTLAYILNLGDPDTFRRGLVGHLSRNGSYYAELITNDYIDGLGADPKNRADAKFRPWVLNQRATLLRQEMTALQRGGGGTGNRYTGPGGLDFALYAAARREQMNLTVLDPGKPRNSLIHRQGQPIIFLRRSQDGGYELGVTDDGKMFSTVPPHKPVISQGPGGIPKEQIPPPLDTMLAGGLEPLLLGTVLQKKYLAELRPTVPRTTVARPESVPDLSVSKIGSFAPIHYMDNLERENHRLFIGPEGKLYNARNGRPFDTGDNPDNIFVMDEFGNLYAAEKIPGLIQHSSFFGGRTVTAAGFVEARDGYITTILDSSGHYVPDLQLNDYALAMLKTKGLRLADDHKRYYVGDDGEIKMRSPEAETEAQRTALERAQRIIAKGPSPTRPFRIYQTDQSLSHLSWDHFPPGTTITFHSNTHSVTATVTGYQDLQVIDHDLGEPNNTDRFIANLDTIETIIRDRDITTVKTEQPEQTPRATAAAPLPDEYDGTTAPHATAEAPHPLSAGGDTVPLTKIPGRSPLRFTSSRLPLLGYPPDKTPHPGRTRPQPVHDTPVQRMNAAQLESHRLFVGPDGRLFRAADGRLFDTTRADSAPVRFAMDESGNLYAGPVTDPRSFLGEHAASAMGTLAVHHGRLTTWSDHTDEHTSPPQHNDYALDLLRRQGLSPADDFTRLDRNNAARDRIGELDRQRTELAHRQILLDAATEVLTRKTAEPPTEPDSLAHRAVHVARQALDQRQTELNRLRDKLGTGAIDKALQEQIFAHPAPAGPQDLIVPPYPSRELENDIDEDDHTPWWTQYAQSWWDSLHFADLAPEHQRRMLDAYPGLRNGRGIPPAVRDTLNRRYLQLEIDRLNKLAALGDLETDLAHRLESMRVTLVDLHVTQWDAALAARLQDLEVPPVRLLYFQHDTHEQDMGAVIAIGHADISVDARWHFPLNSTSDSVNSTITAAAHQHAQTLRTTPGHLTLVRIDRNTQDPPSQTDNIRRFRTAFAGDTFARQTLPTVGDLLEMVHTAVRAHDSEPRLNAILANVASDDDLPAWIDRLRSNTELEALLSKPHEPYPNPERFQNRRVELNAKTDRTEPEERELQALNNLRPDEPGAMNRWGTIESEADLHRELTSYFREEFEREFTADTVKDVRDRLDQATARPMRLTEPMMAISTLRSIDSLATGPDGSVLDVVQQERGYLDIAVHPNPDGSYFDRYRVEWVVPDDAHGLYLGNNANDTDRNTLWLARGTRYRITRITTPTDPNDHTILRAEILPPSAPDQPGTHHPASEQPASEHSASNPLAEETAAPDHPQQRRETVHDAADALMSAIARMTGRTGDDTSADLEAYLDEAEELEPERRAEADYDRRHNEIDDAAWQRELQNRTEFDNWLPNARRIMADLALHPNPTDPQVVDDRLRLASEFFETRVRSVHPDGRVVDINQVPPSTREHAPLVHVHHTPDGHYTVSDTAEPQADSDGEAISPQAAPSDAAQDESAADFFTGL